MASPSTGFYSAGDLRKIRNAICARLALPDDLPSGWTRSPVAVDAAVEAVPSLGLAEGWCLRGYVFREGDNGNGIVWALPLDAGFPEAHDCPKLDRYFLAPPKPPAGREPLEAVKGDHSPRSYLEAALLLYELYEFGALWHGTSWGACTVCDGPPEDWAAWTRSNDVAFDWRPRVNIGADGRAVVEFLVLDHVGRETLAHHRFRFENCGGYVPEVSIDRVAEGGPGVIF